MEGMVSEFRLKHVWFRDEPFRCYHELGCSTASIHRQLSYLFRYLIRRKCLALSMISDLLPLHAGPFLDIADLALASASLLTV